MTDSLRTRLASPDILVAPGCYDALSASLIERAGFAAAYLSGASIAYTRFGRPDLGLVGMDEVAETLMAIRERVTAPIIVDADTGFGNVTNVARTVRLYERAGVAGLFIEDQVFPKRCGHMAGKAVVPTAEWIAKLRSALDARTDPDFVVMARTDALAVHGVDEAIERAQIAREAGADLLFVEAPTDVDQMRRICREVPGPCLANNVEAGRSPVLPASELEAIGYAAVVFPVAATYAVARALRDLFATIRRSGTTADAQARLTTFDEFNELVGLSSQRRREASLTDEADRLVSQRRRR